MPGRGQAVSPIETPVGKLGIITCFELRFPALAAEQKARGAETLFVPAGWVQGENKLLHWRTLLCARAIENGLTVLGARPVCARKICRAQHGVSAGRYRAR